MHTSGLILVAAMWAVGAGALTWLATIPLRRSFAGQLAAPVLIATFASLAAILGSEHAMFYASGDFRVAVVVALAAGLIAAAAAFASAHILVRDTRTVTRAVQAVGQGRRPDVSTARMSGDLARLRAEVDEAARRLNEAGERERSLENSRRELIAWVSHDLRTPLAGLRAMAEALEDGLVETPERYYKQIRVDVDTLTEMVDDLFELSRIQAGALRLGTELISLDDIVSDCIAALEPLARAHQVRLLGSAHGDSVVTGDGRELNRAMTNLIVNAIRHTRDDGAVLIDVRPRPADPADPADPAGSADRTGGGVEVTVTDECGGIPADELARVFDIGFRGEPARTPDPGVPGGAGLGLAITRGIVEAHHGTVEVTNVGSGCRFTIRLPR
jgi:signal transduction histidine kinase